MDEREFLRSIERKITEILVQTQFAEWADNKSDKTFDKTAIETKFQMERAIAYYLGEARFHAIIRLQVGMIMRNISEELGKALKKEQ